MLSIISHLQTQTPDNTHMQFEAFKFFIHLLCKQMSSKMKFRVFQHSIQLRSGRCSVWLGNQSKGIVFYFKNTKKNYKKFVTL